MEYISFKRGEAEKQLNSLSKNQKIIIEDFMKYCLLTAKQNKADDMARNVLKFRLIVGKNFDKIDLKDLQEFLRILNGSNFSDIHKNDVKVHIKKFLKWRFKDWSLRFDDLKDIKQISNPQRQRKIDDKILTKKEIESLVKTENRTYWKAFFLTQYEGALRTQECRLLKWEELKEENEFYTITLFQTKIKRDKPIVLKEAKFYLDKLKQEQRNNGDHGVYVFHAKNDPNQPIDKATVTCWLKALSKRAIGKEIFPYCLRHTRATEYKKLIKEGKLSKDNALETMGHSEKMFDRVYSHVGIDEVKQYLKEQVYKFEDLPEERKHKLEKEIEELRENQKKFWQILKGDLKRFGITSEGKITEA